ncbi:STAS domain-containing protein [Streptomyces sp. NPDC058751]|uniref:STAS domain-containing protein n=1 Tax=Streptomyces sp. NPDC058751 TaxID=3346623 RepID=UPI0036CB9D93
MENEEAHGHHPLEVTTAARDGIVVVTVSGAIDRAGVAPLVQALAPGGPRVVVDMGQVSFMDSSGLNALLAAHRDLVRAEGWLRLAAVPASVRRILRITGVEAVIPSYPGLREALTA